MLRLAPEEAARVLAVALFSLLCLVPSALRLVEHDTPAPAPSCPTGARWAGQRVVCDEGPSTIAPVGQLLLGRKIDLNTGDAASLTVVPGIGERMAARIVEDRRRNGAFTTLEDVERVRGIGPKLRARMAAYLEAR